MERLNHRDRLDACRMALLVMRRESSVADYLSSTETIMICVHTWSAAMDVLRSGARIGLVVTDAELPDGDWRTVVDGIRSVGLEAEVLVRHTREEQIYQENEKGAWEIDLARSA